MMKKILWTLAILMVAIQFIRPSENKSDGPQTNAVDTKYAVSADVKTILEKACNDCHSNNTRYPWYNKIQPVAWWLALHVKKGKKEINFDEFASYSLRRQYHKLEEIEEQVKEGKMPLPSYTITHKDAVLTNEEKDALLAWVASSRAAMEAQYPLDSLIRKK